MCRMTEKRSVSTMASTAALARIVASEDRESVKRNGFVPSQRRVPRLPASGLTKQVSSSIALRLDISDAAEALCNLLERP
jgi:hypothetical protein